MEIDDTNDEQEQIPSTLPSYFSSSSSSPCSEGKRRQKVDSLAEQLGGLLNRPRILFSITIINNSQEKLPVVRHFELTCETSEESAQELIQAMHSLASRDYNFSIRVEWTGSSSSASSSATDRDDDCRPLFQVLDAFNDLELVSELHVSSLRSLNAATRIARYLHTNKRLASLRLGYYLGDWPGLVESAETLGNAVAASSSSLTRVDFFPFSTSSAIGFHNQQAERAMELILQGIRNNPHIQRLHLWAPGMIPSSLIQDTIVDHPAITELFLNGETAPWYRGKGVVDQYHEFQHLVWTMLCSPTCRLEKLKLHNLHLNTRTVDIFLSGLWEGHPLEVLDVSGNFLSSLCFPKFLEPKKQQDDEVDNISSNRLRLLIVEDQCNTFASLEYDLTYYHHDPMRCRQHCHDMMRLLRAKPGLSIHHPKIPAMLQDMCRLPSSSPSLVVEESPSPSFTSRTTTEQLQFLLDYHRIVPQPIRKVDEDFCLALWPMILERCSTTVVVSSMTQQEQDRRSTAVTNTKSTTLLSQQQQRQASVMYKIFQDWSLILLQGGHEEESTFLPYMVPA